MKYLHLTALHLAAYFGKLEVATALIKEGAEKEAKDNIGMTPLHLAAGMGHVEVISKLLEGLKGEELSAVLNAQNNQDKTPLYFAALNCHRDILTLLIAYGADKTVLTAEQRNTYAAEIIKGENLPLSNTEQYKSTIEDTAEALAKQLKLKKKDIPNEIISAIITEFTVEPSYPHNLGNEERSELALDSISRSENIAAAEERAAVDSNQTPSHAEREAERRAQQPKNSYCTIS